MDIRSMNNEGQINLMFIGDICLAGRSASVWNTRPGKSLFEELSRGDLSATSLLIGNLEGVLTKASMPASDKYAIFHAPPELSGALHGLDVALLANNHMGDFGSDGARDTMEQLKQAGIDFVGYGKLFDPGTTTRVIQRHGFSIGLINMCCPTTNPPVFASADSEGVAPISLVLLKEEITRVRPGVDFLVFCPHWGREMVSDPTPEQIKTARLAIDWGVDAVVGHHAHVIQSCEVYRGKSIYYGLGNFIYPEGISTGMLAADTSARSRSLLESERISLVVRMTLRRSDGKTRLSQVRLDQFRFDTDYVPRIMSRGLPGVLAPLIGWRSRWSYYWFVAAEPSRDRILYHSSWDRGRMRYWYSSATRRSHRLVRLLRNLFRHST